MNDRIDEASANELDSSLRLIEVEDLRIAVAVEGAEFRKRKVRGHFTFDHVQYRLSITDPVVERKYLAGPDGESHVGPAVLCISLGEPYKGHVYKLVAGVFLRS